MARRMSWKKNPETRRRPDLIITCEKHREREYVREKVEEVVIVSRRAAESWPNQKAISPRPKMTATVFRINKSLSSNSRITRRSGSANTTRSAQYLECSGAKVQTKGARQETTFVRLLSTKSGRRCAAKASFEPNGVGKVTFNKTERPDGVIAKLKQLGLPAIISYGLLNTLYYVCAFVIAFWSYSAVSSGSAPKPGLKGQFGQALVVLTVVWAGSQVTKVFRASG